MRVFLACFLFAVHAVPARSDEASGADGVPWQTAFESMSEFEGSGLAVIIVITNDDPFIAADLDETRATSVPSIDRIAAPSLWCTSHVEKAYARLVASRPECRNRLRVQGIAAGFPQQLTGGQDRNVPSRAMLALCDREYQLLGIHVGVPHGDELVSMVEEAEQVATTRQLSVESSDWRRFHELIAQDVHKDLNRMWAGVLNDLISTSREKDGGLSESMDRSRLLSVGETLDAAYLADVRRRFGVSDADDQTRLILLEQHLETRRPWCESMLAIIAGEDFSIIWRDLVEMVWRHPPVTAHVNVDELIEWVSLHEQASAVVLSVEPPAIARHYPWPPISDGLSRRVVPWRTTHDLALEHPYRSVSVQQLAALMHHRKLRPIDIQRPSMARYVLLEPNREQPLVIGEGDSPSHFASRLRKSKSSLTEP